MDIFWKSFFHQFNLYEDGSALMWIILSLGIGIIILNRKKITGLSEYLTKLVILLGVYDFLFLCFLSVRFYAIGTVPGDEKAVFLATGLSMSLLPLLLVVMVLLITATQNMMKNLHRD